MAEPELQTEEYVKVVTDKVLRDEFAMAALIGGLSNPSWFSGAMDAPTVAKVCYQMADAMLRERENADNAE